VRALLLNESYFLALLVAGAVLTPLAAWLAGKPLPSRLRLSLAMLGPIALVFWGIHLAVLQVLGFDSIFSVLVMLALGLATGIAAGRWSSKRDPARI
jgi:hypothetical protein